MPPSSIPEATVAPAVARLLQTTTTTPYDSITSTSLATAAAILQAEGLVAFPTETVYGLGASALSATATSSIYRAKGRPSDNPLIVHVASLDMLYDLLPGGKNGVPSIYEPLLARFWPGPLSLIFPLSVQGQPTPLKTLAPAVTAGLPAVAIRMPSHPLALALIAASGLPLAAPSANLSSRPSPTTAEHVRYDLGNGRGLGAILDGGECAVGVESTVVDFLPSSAAAPGGQLRVLRVGGVSAEELEDCLRDAGVEGGKVMVYAKDFKSQAMEEKPTTPGMKYKHYSPTNAKVVLVRPSLARGIPESLLDLIGTLLPSVGPNDPIRPLPRRIGLMFTLETLTSLFPSASTSSLSIISPSTTLSLFPYPLGSSHKPHEAAHRLFAGLRHFDELPPEHDTGGAKGVELILVEAVDEKGVGVAFMERATKAAEGEDVKEFRMKVS